MSANQLIMNLLIPDGLKSSLARMGFVKLTAIQNATINSALQGRDLLGSSQTGTGKTAAYAIPLLSFLYKNPGKQALIVVPTRELATQIHKVLRRMGKTINLTGALILGGESFARQKGEVEGDADYLIATPGRLNDHLEKTSFTLDRIAMLVFDEVDLMMDLGFAPQIKTIAEKLPVERQTLFFSATLPAPILKLAESLLKNPVKATVGATTQPIADVEHVNIMVMTDKKPELLLEEVAARPGQILVFARTKLNVEIIAKLLVRNGQSADFLHGERTQKQRREAIEAFRSGDCRILVATDVAARGLDIPGIETVINYFLPQTREDYIHRVGRAGRNGAKGTAVNFLTPRDKNLLRTLGKIIGVEEPGREGGHKPPAPRFESMSKEKKGKQNSPVPVNPYSGDRKGRGSRPQNPRIPLAEPRRSRSQESRSKDGHFRRPFREQSSPFKPQRPQRSFSAEHGSEESSSSRSPFGARKEREPEENHSLSSRPQNRRNRYFGAAAKPQRQRHETTAPLGDDRPRFAQPEGRFSQGDRQQGDRHYGERPQRSRPPGGFSQGARPQGERPQRSRPSSSGGFPNGPRPQHGARPSKEGFSGARGKGHGRPSDDAFATTRPQTPRFQPRPKVAKAPKRYPRIGE